jgi:predicted tellurium resistance membrane protein TerC
VLKLVDRFPAIMYIGAAVLAYTAAKMIVSEPVLSGVFGTKDAPVVVLRYAVEAVCVALVLGLAWLATRSKSKKAEEAPALAPAHNESSSSHGL